MHVLRDLKTLEQRFPDELVVIGVHSPKFTNEKSTENLKRILVRYEIEHPGGERRQPRDLAALRRARRGRRASSSIPPAISSAPRWARATSKDSSTRSEPWSASSTSAGEINRSPLPLQLERQRHDDQPLLYPGKVLADEQSGRLFIADSNHNRIVVASLDGKLIETIGSGLQGDNDGIFPQARFYRPQGLALDCDDQLYVADTENHQIRVVDFQARAVHTVAGTGKQGAWGGEGGDAMRIDLNSPWDLALKPGILIVAMAGPHQIWVIDLLHDRAYPYAGTGEEARRDGAVNDGHVRAAVRRIADRTATRCMSRMPSPTRFAPCSCRRSIP